MEQKKSPMPPKGNLELYTKAVDLHKKVFKKPIYNKEKYQKKTGYMLQSLFGHTVWTLKDLDNNQLRIVIEICERKINKKVHNSVAQKKNRGV